MSFIDIFLSILSKRNTRALTEPDMSRDVLVDFWTGTSYGNAMYLKLGHAHRRTTMSHPEEWYIIRMALYDTLCALGFDHDDFKYAHVRHSNGKIHGRADILQVISEHQENLEALCQRYT